MGGHGGLNILPQKSWNVYNYENREKVRRDEETAAKEEQLKREQARKRDAEFRLEQLRAARGLAPLNKAGGSEPAAQPAAEPVEVVESESKSGHINLFEGIRIFDPIKGLENEGAAEKDGFKRKKLKKEEAAPRVVASEDEKYRLGYGIAGKGVKLPWYLERRNVDVEEETGNNAERVLKDEGKKTRKKTIQELREEMLKRERREKKREQALLIERNKTDKALKARKFSRRTNIIIINLNRQSRELILMVASNKNSLLHFEDLTLPSFQVIVMTANMGCARCRERVSQVISKMTGLREYTVDVSNKQVIVKADFGLRWDVEEEELPKNEKIKDWHPLKTFKCLSLICLNKLLVAD
ncbi:hypothetical protein PTKIN_Ptkin04bG0207500 [Pterospermum kingtungense]